MSAQAPFHLAIGVSDLEETLRFYTEELGCQTGRTSEHWVDLNLYGHQLVLHKRSGPPSPLTYADVDKDAVPVPHFGVVLSIADWDRLAERLQAAGASFVIEPRTRFAGEAGEQRTFFLFDPSGNALEFKAFRDLSRLFAKD